LFPFPLAAMQTYYVKVTTGTVWGAGTDANVYCVLYGEQDDTGMVPLKSSRTHSNKFETGNTDEFLVEAVNIGDLKKIRYVGLCLLNDINIDIVCLQMPLRTV